MLFVMIGVLRPDVGAVPQEVQEQVNEFLGQPFIDIKTAGVLRDAQGKRAGMMIMVECDDRERAEAFLGGSPYLGAGLYSDVQVYEYASELGAL